MFRPITKLWNKPQEDNAGSELLGSLMPAKKPTTFLKSLKKLLKKRKQTTAAEAATGAQHEASIPASDSIVGDISDGDDGSCNDEDDDEENTMQDVDAVSLQDGAGGEGARLVSHFEASCYLADLMFPGL